MELPESQATAWLALVAVATVLLHLIVPLGTDVSWLLTVNERLADGEHLYADILETNPPMAVWLYALPVALERLTAIPAESYVVLQTLIAGLGAVLVSVRIARFRRPAATALLGVIVLALLPLEEFAQREHYIAFALLPWLAAAVLRHEGEEVGRWGTLAAAAGLAIAIAIKPYFILVALIVFTVLAVHRRSWRCLLWPEYSLAAALLAAYALVVIAVYPAFLETILPAAEAVYVPVRMGLVPLLAQPHVLLFCLVALAAATLLRSERRDLAPLVFAALAGCFLVYLIQGKGWGYHLLPGNLLGLLCCLLLGARRPATAPRLAGLAALFAIFALPQAATAASGLLTPNPLLQLAEYGRGRTLVVISSDIGIGNPVARQLGDTIVGSAPMLWRATGAMQLARREAADHAELAGYETLEHRDLATDLRSRPDLVIADIDGFDWLAWARRDPVTAAELRGYGQRQTITTPARSVVVLERKP